ncbi:hypothetical protein [Xanthomonas oryzae]|uniref:Uncharacterized protein n=1 Tax=Xanthomonas oryzae pv. leersiae TaxID=3112258 RepID=A0AAJ6GX57_9XANT|nr:hypothetical protein [Xanthomonas oryzae]WIX05815.1 hypothetical protein QN060_16805 [Xanthomonas oryzae pv. oryzae]
MKKFLVFIAAVQWFLIAAKAENSVPRTMSLAAARQRLDAMRRGEIRPSVKPISFDRAAELSKLGDYLKSIDALALRPESWWSSVMEQFNDGLL